MIATAGHWRESLELIDIFQVDLTGTAIAIRWPEA
jgi:hypothetical protein